MASDSIDICLVVPASRSIHRTDNDTASMTTHGLWHGRYSLNTPRYLHSQRRFAIDRIATRCQSVFQQIKAWLFTCKLNNWNMFSVREHLRFRKTVYDTFVLVFDEQVDRMSNRIQTCCCLTYWNHALIRKSQFFFGRWGQKCPHRRKYISIWTVSSLYSESRHKHWIGLHISCQNTVIRELVPHHSLMNTLPVTLQTVSSYLTFRRELKTFLFNTSFPDNWTACVHDFVKWPCSYWEWQYVILASYYYYYTNMLKWPMNYLIKTSCSTM